MGDVARLKLLIVDDDAWLLKLLKSYLTRDPRFELTAHSDSTLAARLLHEDTFELLITDYQMPVICGAQLARIARQVQPELPVLAISGVESLGRETCEWADAFLSKPFPLALLTSTIIELTSTRTAHISAGVAALSSGRP